MAGSSERSYEVHLNSLFGFAGDLDNDLEALIRIASDLDVLKAGTSNAAALGDFTEGHWLMQRHETALTDISELVQSLRDTVTFAREVTMSVANQYASDDRTVAADFSNIASHLSPGGFV